MDEVANCRVMSPTLPNAQFRLIIETTALLTMKTEPMISIDMKVHQMRPKLQTLTAKLSKFEYLGHTLSTRIRLKISVWAS